MCTWKKLGRKCCQMSPILGSNPGSNPFFSRTGELFFARPLEKRIPVPRSGALENFRPQNRVFTPHFLSKITSIRVVYGVNRNLLIEICPKPPSPQPPPRMRHGSPTKTARKGEGATRLHHHAYPLRTRRRRPRSSLADTRGGNRR